MKKLNILNQPNDSTCGPTCLHAVYKFFKDNIELEDLISEVKTLENGGTLAVMLANHALKRGYEATLYTYNLAIFDPSWFPMGKPCDLVEKLEAQMKIKKGTKLRGASKAYVEFLKLGGTIKFKDLTPFLLEKLFSDGNPILTGLSSTYLYKSQREISIENDMMQYNDVEGFPTGHFVVLNGFYKNRNYIKVADPFKENPVSGSNYYTVSTRRLINAILLGIVTYDSNILILKPKKRIEKNHHRK